MDFLLDTNVVSELRKDDRADPGLRRWFDDVRSEDLALSVLVLGEIRLGIHRLRGRDPDSAGRLAIWLARVEVAYEGRILAVDAPVADAWAELNAARSLPVVDSLLAATALVHGLTLVTRNLQDVEGVPVPLLDPFARSDDISG